MPINLACWCKGREAADLTMDTSHLPLTWQEFSAKMTISLRLTGWPLGIWKTIQRSLSSASRIVFPEGWEHTFWSFAIYWTCKKKVNLPRNEHLSFLNHSIELIPPSIKQGLSWPLPYTKYNSLCSSSSVTFTTSSP